MTSDKTHTSNENSQSARHIHIIDYAMHIRAWPKKSILAPSAPQDYLRIISIVPDNNITGTNGAG